MLSAGAIAKSPVMIFVGVIILGVLIVVAVVFSNLYGHLTDSELGTASDNVTIGGLFMQYLPYIVVAGIVLLVISLSLKDGGSTGL